MGNKFRGLAILCLMLTLIAGVCPVAKATAEMEVSAYMVAEEPEATEIPEASENLMINAASEEQTNAAPSQELLASASGSSDIPYCKYGVTETANHVAVMDEQTTESAATATTASAGAVVPPLGT